MGSNTQSQWKQNSPLISLKGNNSFLPGKGKLFGEWIKHDNVQLKDIMTKGKIYTFQE